MPSNNFINYTVKAGDSIWAIAKKNNLTVSELLNANPQINHPQTLNAGEVIRIPREDSSAPAQQLSMPCCALLLRANQNVLPDAAGTALVQRLEQLRPGRTSITIVAHGLPEPSNQGNFNSYEAIAFVPNVITWRWRLYPTTETPPTWSGTFSEITLSITPQTVVQVRPVNLSTNQAGLPILANTIANCIKNKNILV